MIFLLLVSASMAFESLPLQYQGKTQTEIQNQSSIQPKRIKSTSKKIDTNYLKYKQLLRNKPSFGSQFENVLPYDRFKGVVDGNVRASSNNVRIKVKLKSSSSFPQDSYIGCNGSVQSHKYNYRVLGQCSELISNGAVYKISAVLKDRSMVDGIIPDHVYTGEEEEFLGGVFTSMAGLVLDSKKDRTLTGGQGYVEDPTIKNAINEGVTEGIRESYRDMKHKTSNKRTILTIFSGKEVFVEFTKEFTHD